MKRRLIAIFLLLTLLSGCAGEQQAAGGSVTTETNQTAEATHPAGNTGFYGIVENVLLYRDETIGGKGVPVCPQPGCSHLDSSCPARIGEDMSSWEVHGDYVYLTMSHMGNGSQLIERDLVTGEERVIVSWENVYTEDGKDILYHASGMVIAEGTAIVHTEEQICYFEGLEFIQEHISHLWRIDLETGEMTELFTDEDVDEISVTNLYGDQALVIYNPWKTPREDLLTKEEFYQQYGEDASYGRYCQLNSGCELRLYDLSSGEYSVIASAEEGYVRPPDGMSTYGTKSLYKLGNDLHLYDIATGEDRIFVTMETIINYWLFDHEVFIITQDGDYTDTEAENHYYYASLEDGVPVEVGRNSQGQMAFMPYAETANCFYGIYADDEARKWITREDFFAGNYDRAY